MNPSPGSNGSIVPQSQTLPRKKKIGPRISVEVIAEFKKLAELLGKDFEDLIEEAMKEYIAKHKHLLEKYGVVELVHELKKKAEEKGKPYGDEVTNDPVPT